MEKLGSKKDGYCTYNGCAPAIVDVGKMGQYAIQARTALDVIAEGWDSLCYETQAHAYVTRVKIDPLLKGSVEDHISSLANDIREKPWDRYKAKEAAIFASYPEYTDTVIKTFLPLLNNKWTFINAVTAIAGAGSKASHLVSQMLLYAPTDKDFVRNEGDDFAHELEKIIGWKAVESIRKERGYECHCWL